MRRVKRFVTLSCQLPGSEVRRGLQFGLRKRSIVACNRTITASMPRSSGPSSVAKRICRQLDRADIEWFCTCMQLNLAHQPTQMRAIGFKTHCHVSAAGAPVADVLIDNNVDVPCSCGTKRCSQR